MVPIRILLINPPGKQVYIRDYYCSKVSKSNYLFHPVDLLMLSGRLSERYDVHVIDAMADRRTESVLLQEIDSLAPDVIIAMIGAVSIEEDCSFLANLKKPGRRIVVSGDVVLENAEEWLHQHPYVDAALLDFTSEDIVRYVEAESGPLQGVATGDDVRQTEKRKRPLNQEYTLPVPRHDLFSSRYYRFPFVRHREFATVLTDYGCPFSCTFCNMSKIGYKYRPVENIINELRFLKELGKRELFLIDQTFGVSRKRTLALCARMKEEDLTFGWACFSRVDLLTEELIAAMQQSGCHTIMLGVETASSAVLEKYRKGYTKTQIQEAFRLCKARKIRTVATFILGLPEETEETARETLAFSKELDCDFASFNIAVPRMGTSLRQEAIRECLILPDLEMMDQTGASIAMPTRYLTKDQIKRIRNKAIMDFYLRPGYLWRRATSITTFYELSEHLSEGWALLGSLWARGNDAC
jgi:anaerobic magnesium-protoporphyrin IX monomethyl ester cyclase